MKMEQCSETSAYKIPTPVNYAFFFNTYLPMMMCSDSVPKRRHIKFRHRGITQKKAYSIQNTAKVWNKKKDGVPTLQSRASAMSLLYLTAQN